MRKTPGIVLRTADFKDSDRMLTLLTKDFGLMAAKVRSAKKQTSKLFSASSLFCCGDYEFYEKGGYYGVRGCRIRYTFHHLLGDYDAFSAACFIADAAGKVAQEDFAAPKLFALTVCALYALDTAAVSPGTVLCYFIQRLLWLEGLYPILDACVVCGSAKNISRFSIEHGGAVCGTCAKTHAGVAADKDVFAALSGMACILPKDIGVVSLLKDTERKLKSLLVDYLEYNLQKPLKSSRFIRK
ncbi:MAG: DNA repair protein RecO [Christensenellales bacterium]